MTTKIIVPDPTQTFMVLEPEAPAIVAQIQLEQARIQLRIEELWSRLDIEIKDICYKPILTRRLFS